MMLFEQGTRQYLSDRRREWMKRLESTTGDRERFEFFLARFDPDNYTETALPDGQIQFEHKLPAHLEMRSREAQEGFATRRVVLQLPDLARRGIAEGRGFKEDDLDELVRRLQHIATHNDGADDPFMKKRTTEAIAGGIAILVLQHREWLSRNPNAEKWCFGTLQDLALCEPDQTYSPYDASDTSTEGFVGQTGIALLGEINEEWVRHAVIAGVTGYHYDAVFHVLNTAYRMRERLGEEFTRLQNTMLLWAVLRLVAQRVMSATADNRVLERYRGMILKRYLEGRIPTSPLSLRKANALGVRLLRRVERRKPGYWGLGRDREEGKKFHRLNAGLDLELVRQGLGFLAEMTYAAKTSERADVLASGSELLEFELSMIPKMSLEDVDIDLEGTLYEFDIWAFERVVQIMLSGVSLAEARGLWKPILDLPIAAHQWVREFFVEWFRLGLASGADTFQPIWEEMVSYVLDSTTWSPNRRFNSFHVHDVVAEMMGIRSAQRTLGNASHANLIERMAPLYKRWAAIWVGHADLARSFAQFLATEAGSVLLPMGLCELATRLDSFSDYDWRRDHLQDTFSSAVRACWKKNGQRLRSDGGLWKCFLAVLNELCARNDDLSLAIRLELARESN